MPMFCALKWDISSCVCMYVKNTKKKEIHLNLSYNSKSWR